MIIQKILFPSNEICSESLLYFRTSGKISNSKQSVTLFQGEYLNTNTYFNCFSVGKWNKYTELKDCRLSFSLAGSVVIQLIHSFVEEGRVVEKILNEKHAKSKTIKEFSVVFSVCGHKGIYYFNLIAEDKSIFYGGAIEGLTSITNDVHLALNICTRNRQNYLIDNLDKIRKNVLYNQESRLYSKLDIYVANNGKPVITDIDEVNIFELPGLGSSGGFSYGAVQICKDSEVKKITHAIFMDDDILLDTEVLERTFSFLSYLKKEESLECIGGALLRLDQKYIQHESGATWNRGNVRSIKSNYDLRQSDSIIWNEIEEKIDYFGWWYCCIPVETLKKKGLALPIYFHCEDIELGIRTKQHITLNSIAVWHEPFENKQSASTIYYDTRNMAIINSVCYKDWTIQEYIKCLQKKILSECIRFRYRNAKVILLAAEDFCNNIDVILRLDFDNKFEQVMNLGYINKSIPCEVRKKYNTRRKINCSLAASPWKKFIFAKETLFLDSKRKNGYIVKKNLISAFQIYFQFLKLKRQLLKHKEKYIQQWRESSNAICKLESWEDYFKMYTIKGESL